MAAFGQNARFWCMYFFLDGKKRDFFIVFSVCIVCNFVNDNKDLPSITVVPTSFLSLSFIPVFFLTHKLQGCSLSVFFFFLFRNHNN